ncbi:MAG TPA: GGDEF domain-containing protein [Rubrobacter sp.]|nr:GGDEF domain-containing protein [Rubrobacter sp.]
MAARIGGDEFAVLLEDVADADEAVGVAERFQAQLSVPLDVDGYRLCPSASISIAADSQGPPEKLMRAADAAMFQAKRSGKGRSVVFDPEPR